MPECSSVKFFKSQYGEYCKPVGRSDFDGTNTYSIFHKVFLVPYPISNPIGKVESGMLSLNKYKNEAVRISLPSAYDFPISVAMFKRNLLKQTIDIENTDKKLIIYNVHMEAYEENNTRTKQLSILRDDMMNEYSKGNKGGIHRHCNGCTAGGNQRPS